MAEQQGSGDYFVFDPVEGMRFFEDPAEAAAALRAALEANDWSGTRSCVVTGVVTFRAKEIDRRAFGSGAPDVVRYEPEITATGAALALALGGTQ